MITIDCGTLLEIVAFFIGLALGVHLITVVSGRNASLFLGFYLLSFSLEIGFSVIPMVFPFSGMALEEYSTLNLFQIPLLVWYVDALTGRFSGWRKGLLLFLPGLLHTILNLMGIVSGSFLIQEFVSGFFYFFSYLFNSVLLIYILNLLHRHRKVLKDQFSSLSHKTLNWVRLFVYTLLLFEFFWLLEDLLLMVNPENIYSPVIADFSAYATFLTVYVMGFLGLHQPAIFQHNPTDEMVDNLSPEIEGKGEPLDLKGTCYDKEIALFIEVQRKLENYHYYKEKDLSLRLLADKVGLKEKQLSYILNTYGQVNFYQFINQYRLAAFKKISLDPDYAHLSIEGMAKEVGFKSKSTFFAFFKKMEGTTPKEFLKKNVDKRLQSTNNVISIS